MLCTLVMEHEDLILLIQQLASFSFSLVEEPLSVSDKHFYCYGSYSSSGNLKSVHMYWLPLSRRLAQNGYGNDN